VKRFHKYLALFLTLLWPLAASHCALENLSNSSFLACNDGGCCAPQPAGDCESDACAIVESGWYKSDYGRLHVTPPPVLMVCLLELPVEISNSFATRIAVPETSPPELPQLWRFSQHTALLPRAPSFVS